MASERDSVFQLAFELFRTIEATNRAAAAGSRTLSRSKNEPIISARLRTVAPQHAAPHIEAKRGKEGAEDRNLAALLNRAPELLAEILKNVPQGDR